MSSLRVVSVDYVNARPLVRGLAADPRVSLAQTTPAGCSEALGDAKADVGLIPSIEFQRIPGLGILPGICIASRRRARSVLLLSKVPAPEIRSVALDSSSRTSAALLRLLLDRRARGRVEYHPAAPDLDTMLHDHDAALLIGDRALCARTDGLRVYDLATEWFEMTGLPFVFAFWAVRPGTELPDGVRPFLASRRAGLESLDRIAAEEALRLSLPAARILDYLRDNIHYDLGPEQARSLWLFYRLARQAGLLSSLRDLRFFEQPHGRKARSEAREYP